ASMESNGEHTKCEEHTEGEELTEGGETAKTSQAGVEESAIAREVRDWEVVWKDYSEVVGYIAPVETDPVSR
ncbi:hypothetical protein LTS12_027110, partial [Elasticomyces elasticus]